MATELTAFPSLLARCETFMLAGDLESPVPLLRTAVRLLGSGAHPRETAVAIRPRPIGIPSVFSSEQPVLFTPMIFSVSAIPERLDGSTSDDSEQTQICLMMLSVVVLYNLAFCLHVNSLRKSKSGSYLQVKAMTLYRHAMKLLISMQERIAPQEGGNEVQYTSDLVSAVGGNLAVLCADVYEFDLMEISLQWVNAQDAVHPFYICIMLGHRSFPAAAA